MKRASTNSSSSAGSNWKALKKSLESDSASSSRTTANTTSAKLTRTKKEGVAATSLTKGDTADTNIRTTVPTTLPWFAEDISPEDLELVRQTASGKMATTLQWDCIADSDLKKKVILGGLPADASEAKRQPGNYLAIDCEMVGVGKKGCESVLARVSIVNFHGATILDRFVKPQEKVTDYRTWVSGVRPKDLKNAMPFVAVQAEVAQLIKGKVLVGHAIQNDLKALLLSHPRPLIRDTAIFQPLRDLSKTKYPSLKKLAKLVLSIDIQVEGESHSSVEDARATMAVFRSQKSKWDDILRSRSGSTSQKSFATSRAKSGGVPLGSGTTARVWQAPANDAPSDPSSPALARRATSSSNSFRPEPSRLKPKKSAQADWWKDS